MKDSFSQLVDALSSCSSPVEILRKLISLLEEHIPHSVESLVALERWTWIQLADHSREWIIQPIYLTFFRTFATFNKNLIFTDDDITDDVKALLLIPDTTDYIEKIFVQVNECADESDLFISIINLWFDNLSFFIYECPQYSTSSVIRYLNEYMAYNYLMTDQFSTYLNELSQIHILQIQISQKQLFYLRTCSFSLSVYLVNLIQSFPFTSEEILTFIGNIYIRIINVHCHTLESWNNEFLGCIAHLTLVFLASFWWSLKSSTQILDFFRIEQSTCDFVQGLVCIVCYEPFHREIKSKRYNNETILIDGILKVIFCLSQIQNMNYFLRSNRSLSDLLLTIAEKPSYDETCILAYAILGEILNEKQLKELKVTDEIFRYFENILRQAWHQPLKKYKHMPVLDLLQGFSSLAKSDAIQQTIADKQAVLLFVEMCDEFPIVYDILWALSFNEDIQQQLRLNTIFMSKLSHLAKECDNEQMRKITHGLLWNLEINQKDHTATESTNQQTFDMMISYSHKNKELCRQIYDELIEAGYRVWIDFDQMHGNVMDAMAQAIESSQTVIICMSEEYRKSNYCRAEAHYAFQRQRKIVPILLQKHYKPDGWLLFLVGQLLYVDFTKHEFNRAMEMLHKELRETCPSETRKVQNHLPKLSLSPILPVNISDWSKEHVQQWLAAHDLLQMSHLLHDFNGPSLLYLDEYVHHGNPNQILTHLQEDCVRKTKQTLSLIELSRFRSLLDEQKSPPLLPKKRSFLCCRIM